MLVSRIICLSSDISIFLGRLDARAHAMDDYPWGSACHHARVALEYQYVSLLTPSIEQCEGCHIRVCQVDTQINSSRWKWILMEEDDARILYLACRMECWRSRYGTAIIAMDLTRSCIKCRLSATCAYSSIDEKVVPVKSKWQSNE